MDGLGLGQGLVDGPERRGKAARSWVMVDKIEGLEGPRVLDGPQGGTETAGEREDATEVSRKGKRPHRDKQ